RPCNFMGIARSDAALKVLAFSGVSRERERGAEMESRRVAPLTAKLHVPERRKIERIGGQAIAVLNRVNRIEATLRPFGLGDRNGAAQRDHRRRAKRKQQVI